MSIIAAVGSRPPTLGHGSTPPDAYLASMTIAGPSSGVATHGVGTYTLAGKDQYGDPFSVPSPTFSTTDSGVATINASTGVASAVSAGTTVISATAVNSNSDTITASNPITLTIAAQVVTTVVLSGPTSVVATHTTTAYAAQAKDQLGSNMAGTPSFASGTAGVATIDSTTGVATGVSAGSSSITATISAVTSNAITLMVAAQVPTGTITVTPSSFSVNVGSTQALTATVYDQGSPANPISGATVTWSSTDALKASVNTSTGLVTGVAAGSATINAVDGSASGSSAATVTAVAPTSITVTPNPVTLSPAGTQQLTVTDNLGNDVTSLCTFSTNTPSVATVDAPTLTSATPNTEAQGASSQNIALVGTNFRSGQTATFSNAGITVNSTTVNSSTSITANITVSGSATPGAGTVNVSDSTHGDSNTQAFTVTSSAPSFHWAWVFQETGSPVTSPPSYAIVVNDPNTSGTPYAYPQSASGKPDWGLYGFSGTDHARTRNAAFGQTGGLEFQANSGTQPQLQIAVPNGTFDINLACGDVNSSSTHYVYVYDDTTLVAQLNGVTAGGSNNVKNLAGTAVAATSWAFNTGKSSVTFSSGICRVKWGSPTAQTGTSGLVTFELNQTA